MATVKFYLRKPRTKDVIPNQEVSIYAVFTVDRTQRFEITIKEKIQPKYWNAKGQVVKSFCRGHQEINAYLEDFKYKLKTLHREHREMPFDKFRELVLTSENRNQKKTLFLAYEQFLKAYQSEKDSKTVAKYLTLEKHLIAFDTIHAIDFPNLDFSFYDRFKSYLLAIPNPFYRKFSLHPDSGSSGQYYMVPDDKGLPIGIFDDNVYSYIIQLKTFLAWSEKRGYQVHNSFKTWEIIRRVYPPITLTAAELEQLESKVFNSKALDVARDYLVMEARTGQRISDIKRFTPKDYNDFKWTFTPRKGNRLSNKSVTVHFKGYCASALFILQKYNWQMPVISEQKLNENIKRACKEAGIDQEISIYRWAANKRIRISGKKYEFISSHTGRKTFITLALQAGTPVEYVMQLTGISEYKTIRHYKGEFEDNKVEGYLNGIGEALMRKSG
jgi:integrase